MKLQNLKLQLEFDPLIQKFGTDGPFQSQNFKFVIDAHDPPGNLIDEIKLVPPLIVLAIRMEYDHVSKEKMMSWGDSDG
jgi:hypothetical protein